MGEIVVFVITISLAYWVYKLDQKSKKIHKLSHN